ncbi:MAG: cytochrome c oxidase subunit II [Proteobacteria bacterium]|nr:cytochrome c oxidase subunit II [Pseudomonadota bacterium]
MKTILSRLSYLIFSLLLCANAAAAWQLGMQEPASEMAATQQFLNEFVMWIIVIIGIGVFGIMFYSIVRHRKDKGYKAANFHENTLVEIIWTAVPMFIIIGMALPATSAIIDYKNTSSPDLTVKVTGIQWKWEYDYLDKDVAFYSQLSTAPEEIGGKYYGSDATANPQSDHYLLEVDNEMVVPVGKKVRLLLTAADVIHAWWVPQLGVKQDAIPGVVRDAWFEANRPGVYRGQCAELCGKNHGFMPIVVRAVPEDEFNAWIVEQGGKVAASDEAPNYVGADTTAATAEDAAPVEWTMEVAMQQGETAYNTYCAACHQANGEGLLPAFPALKNSKIALGDIAEHIDIVINGKAGTSMAAFSYLSASDLAAIITYERNAWGNDTGDLIAPEDIKK